MLPHIFVHQGFHLILQATPSLQDFQFSWGFENRREQTTKCLSVDNSAPCFTRTSNTSVNKSDETMQKSVKDFCYISGLYHEYLWISLCWIKVFIMEGLLLQQSCNKYRLFLLTAGSPCLRIMPFHVSLSVPMRALKSPKRIIGSVDLTLWRALLTSSTKVWYLLTGFEVYSCNRHIDQSFKLQHTGPWSQRNLIEHTVQQLRACENFHIRLGRHT